MTANLRYAHALRASLGSICCTLPVNTSATLLELGLSVRHGPQPRAVCSTTRHMPSCTVQYAQQVPGTQPNCIAEALPAAPSP